MRKKTRKKKKKWGGKPKRSLKAPRRRRKNLLRRKVLQEGGGGALRNKTAKSQREALVEESVAPERGQGLGGGSLPIKNHKKKEDLSESCSFNYEEEKDAYL